MPLPSVLEYARYHGLAINHRTAFEEDLTSTIQLAFANVKDHNDESSYEEWTSVVHSRGYNNPSSPQRARVSLSTKEVSRLLEIVSMPLRLLKLNYRETWQRLLQNHKQHDQLRLHSPLLMSDVEDMREAVDTDNFLQDLLRDHSNTARITTGFGYETNDSLNCFSIPDVGFRDEMKKEKLQVSENVLQNLRALIDNIQSNSKVAEATAEDPMPILNEHRSSPLAISWSEEPLKRKGSAESVYRVLHTSSKQLLSYCGREVEELKQLHNEDQVLLLKERNVFNESSCDYKTRGNITPYTEYTHNSTKRATSSFRNQTKRRKLSVSLDSIDAHRLVESAQVTNMSPSLLRQSETGMRRDLSPYTISDIDSESLTCCTSILQEQAMVGLEIKHSQFQITPDNTAVGILSLIHSSSFSASKTALLKRALQNEKIGRALHAKTAEKQQAQDFNEKSTYLIEKGTIEGDRHHVQNTISSFESAVSSEKLLWKTSGLKTFNTDLNSDSEDDLMPDDYQTIGSDDEYGLRHDSISSEQAGKPTVSPQSTIVEPRHDKHTPKATFSKPIRSPMDCIRRATSNDSTVHVQGNLFSTSTSLSNFLALRGKKFVSQKHEGLPAAKELKDDPIESTQQSVTTCSSFMDSKARLKSSVLSSQRAAILQGTFQSDQIPLQMRRSIVLNNTLMQSHRELILFCEQNSGDLLEIVYRDFTVADRAHADIILNPTTSLLIINAQQFRQISLPGEKPSMKLPNAKERVANLTREYKTTFALISMPITLDPQTVAEVSAYCASLQCSTSNYVRPIFVPFATSGELNDALKTWVWALIREHAYPGQNTTCSDEAVSIQYLIQDETMWERFLRQAGMNIMAAQLMLGHLKKVDPDQLGSVLGIGNQKALAMGLRQFVEMDLRTRLHLFGNIVGTGAIEVVSSVVDNSLDGNLCT